MRGRKNFPKIQEKNPIFIILRELKENFFIFTLANRESFTQRTKRGYTMIV
jgi:hypothetical protein